MATRETTLSMPETLADEASRLGLLETQAVQEMVREALRQRHIVRMFATMDELVSSATAPMTLEEIQAEVKKVRAQRRASGH